MNESRTIANGPLLDHVCALIASGKRVKLRPKGKSMRPFIREETDTLILTTPLSLHRGDIVLARTERENYVIHRIIRDNGEHLVLAGDGNLFGRETVRRQSVYGVADTLVRNGTPRSLTAFRHRLLALGWYMLLPIRRGVWKWRNLVASHCKKYKNRNNRR